MRDYGQFCPIARSSELLAESWTPIIIRNLLNGCRTFNEIRQGAPGISTALLAQRLDALERRGCSVASRRHGRRVTYELSEMGHAFRPVLDAMGQWAARWLEIQPRHLGAAYVLWATLKLVNLAGSRRHHGPLPPLPTTRDDYWMLFRRRYPNSAPAAPATSRTSSAKQTAKPWSTCTFDGRPTPRLSGQIA